MLSPNMRPSPDLRSSPSLRPNSPSIRSSPHLRSSPNLKTLSHPRLRPNANPKPHPLAIAVPKPRRGLRSVLLICLLVLGPYILLRHLGGWVFPSADSDAAGAGKGKNAQILRDRKGLVPEERTELGTNGQVSWKDRLSGGGFGRGSGSGGGKGTGDEEYEVGDLDDLSEADSGQEKYTGPNSNSKSKPKSQSKSKSKSKLNSIHTEGQATHHYLPNGLLIPDPEASHPIYDLLASSKAAWEDKLSRQSTTLAEAVDEYRRRYERDPPRGFERWWAYAERNGVGLKDEYDQIHHDLEPFHALTPARLQTLVREASTKSGMYTISCPGITHTKSSKVKPGSNKSKLRRPSSGCVYKIVETGLNDEGRRVASERARAQLELLEDVEELLEEVKVVMYSHDVPWQFVGHEYRSALEDSAAVGEFYNTDEHEIDTAHLGWASACAPHKPLRETYDPDVLPDLDGLWTGAKSFVWDHKAAMDPCTQPSLTHLVGFLSGHGKGPGPSKELFPVMAMCKTTLHADVLGVSMEAWTEDVGYDPAWEDKKDDRMLWRGKTTGIYFKEDVPWNISQRINLVSQSAQTTGVVPIYSPPSTDNVDAPIGEPKNTALSQLNDKLMDVAFVDEAIQCDREVCEAVQEKYKFGERKDWKQGNEYKYLIDIDGNGWSARFKRLMTTNSVILKSTIFPEWYTDRIQPWVHYIPIKADLTDLYDVLSFFRANEENDKLAKEIAVAGKEWSKTFWRKEDMIAYQFRLFLEYARLTAPDRQKASFTLRGHEL